MFDPKLVPGGGAVEMAISHSLREKSKTIDGVQQWPYREVASGTHTHTY
jgi:T-complex protein 1 subunit gamma